MTLIYSYIATKFNMWNTLISTIPEAMWKRQSSGTATAIAKERHKQLLSVARKEQCKFVNVCESCFKSRTLVQ